MAQWYRANDMLGFSQQAQEEKLLRRQWCFAVTSSLTTKPIFGQTCMNLYTFPE
uniref:Uncharacterized protein n=1 Tax=Arion vulgaris TaxID=1028688 RepID=A0A0B6ZHV3_9EUPU